MRDYAEYSKHENIFVFCWRGGPVTQQIIQAGHKVYILEKEKIGSRRLFKSILDINKTEKPQAVIVHHESPLLWLFVRYIAGKNPAVKTFCYAHCNARSMLRDNEKGLWLRKLICRSAFNHCTRVIAISHSVEDSVAEYLSVPRERISVIYNGVNLKRFPPHTRAAGDGLRLIYVGRLIKDKGVQGILKSLAETGSDKITLTVVGDGDYRDALEQQARRLGIRHRVEFLGARDDVPQLLASADAFVHFPEWEEGFGIAIIEAMASGLVCICGRSGAIPEIITHGSNGYLVDKGDTSMLAERLNLVLSQRDTAELSDICREAIKTATCFSLDRFAQQLDRVAEGKYDE